MVFEDALRVPGEQERLKVDPYAWAPFGGGIRRCLGMAFALHEMKVILATMFGMGLRLELENRKPHETILRSAIYSPKGETRVLMQEWAARARLNEGPATAGGGAARDRRFIPSHCGHPKVEALARARHVPGTGARAARGHARIHG